MGLTWWYSSIIPATQEVEIRKIMVQGQPGKNVSKTPSQPANWVWWWHAVIAAMRRYR
jgi:hypothetical protein